MSSGGALRVGLDLLIHRSRPLLCRDARQEPRRDDLLRRSLRLDLSEDRLHEIRVLLEERGRVLPALAEPLVAVAEVRPGLLDDLPLQPDLEDGALPGDAGAVDDVELRLLERGRDLVLDHLDASTVAVGLGPVLERLDPANVQPYRGVELQRPPS